MLTACSISSTDIRMSTALRLASTPYMPSENRIVLSTRKRSIGIMAAPPPRRRESGRGKRLPCHSEQHPIREPCQRNFAKPVLSRAEGESGEGTRGGSGDISTATAPAADNEEEIRS